MKLRNIVASFLAVVAMSVSCVDELSGDLGSIKLDKSTIVMPEQGGSATITINAMTDWSVDAATVPEGVTVTPMSGKAGETKMTISTAGGSLNDIASDIVIIVGKQKQFIKFYQPGDPSMKPQFDEFTAGDYWIMCQEAGEWFALKSTGCTIDDSGSYNYLYSVPAVVGENGTLSSTASNIFTFEAVEGGFIIKDPAGGYLYQVAKYNNFYLTSDKAQASVWAVNQISADEFMLEISDLGKWMQYSTSYDSAGAYATAQDGATLPKLVKAEEPAVEPFIIETTEFTLPIEAGELLIPVEYNGTDIHVGELPSWLKFYGYHDGSIKFGYEENTGGKREAKVILTTCMEGGNEFDVELTFTQTGSIQEVSVADFLAAEVGPALYKLTGKIANIVMDKNDPTKVNAYGNFDLVDATGSVYVYGLTATPQASNDKSFASLGLKEGDIVTIVGTRAVHNDTPQVGGPAYYVSHVAGSQEPEQPAAPTIASVLALGINATVPANTVVEGLVISNMDLNNLTSKKGMYIQDETAGLQFYLAANHEFKFGDKVKVDLSGAKIAEYNGAIQISGLALDKITKVSSGNTVTAKTVTIDDFLANKYEGQYVAIEGVQVVDADLSKTWVSGGAHTSIKIENAEGKNFVVFSSKYATYGASTVAQGSGTIKGISSINKGNMQLIFAQNSDYAGLTGARLGQGSTEPEPTPGDMAHALTSNIEWTLGNKAFSEKATINGNADVPVLKLGTSSVVGDATVVIPAGTKKVGFYGVAWKGKKGTITASAELAGGQFFSQDLVANEGATNSTPYTMTVAESDYYEIDVVALLGSACPMDLTVNLSTVSGATRVILFGLNAYAE